ANGAGVGAADGAAAAVTATERPPAASAPPNRRVRHAPTGASGGIPPDAASAGVKTLPGAANGGKAPGPSGETTTAPAATTADGVKAARAATPADGVVRAAEEDGGRRNPRP